LFLAIRYLKTCLKIVYEINANATLGMSLPTQRTVP